MCYYEAHDIYQACLFAENSFEALPPQ